MSLRERLFQVYTYLQELSRLRNPVVCEIKEYTWIRSLAGLRRHPSLTIHLNSDKETDVFLEVRRPDLTHPSHLLVDADPAAGTGGHTQDVMRLYEDLYELKTRLDREAESYELILGDGILDWPINETTRIYHPIILQKVRLEFDPAVPEFAIVKTEQPPELYSTVLSAHTSVSALVIRSLRQIMEQRGIGPANGERTSNYLREIASQISPRGLFMDDGMPEGRPDAPQITRSPILFLRRRTMGLGLALQAILDDIGQRAEFPQSIARIVGVDAVDNQLREREFDKGRSVPDRERDYDEDILFTKEANLEQRQIARRLDRFGAVLVQGPPGTGKTHTIANLLGHLLAQGKTVLVTAHTEKALKVLRDKVVDPLKPLCVSMLSDDRNYMEAAVDAIIDRLSQSDAGELERAALKLARERLELIRELEAATEQLAEARADEYRPISIAGSNYAPSTAARMVRESRLAYSWIPGQVPTGVPMPLSEAEINQLYRTNTLIVSPDAEDSFETLEPGSLQPDKIPSPAEIEKIVREKKRLSSENFWHHKEYWSDPPGDQTPEKLDSLLLSLVKATETISNSPDWLLAVLEAGKEKSYLITTWGDLLLQIKNADELALEATTAIYRTDADIPRHLLAGRAERALNEIIGFLERGNQLNSFKLFLNKEWREIIESARINRKHPSTIGDFHTLRLILQFNRSRAELLDRWKRQVTTLGGPAPEDLGPEPEKTCRQFIPLIRQKLVWHTAIWETLIGELHRQGFRWEEYLSSISPDNSPHGDLKRLRKGVLQLADTFEAQKKRLNFQRLIVKWESLETDFLRLAMEHYDSDIAQNLVSAFRHSDPDSYRAAYEKLTMHHNRAVGLKLRKALLEKLTAAAPDWADAIRHRIGPHAGPEPPGSPSSAWEWRQLNDELERRSRTSLIEIQSRLEELRSRLREITIELVEKKAWAAQLRRTSLRQQQALCGWKEIMHRLSRAAAGRNQMLGAEARRLAPICQSAIPVWIMPLNQIAENFDPGSNRFDVVIIDEASQADVMALIPLYMGEKAVIVGDHEQVSPIAVGQSLEQVRNLISQYLEGIPNSVSYDGQMSIYNLAQASFSGTISLREHFRCVPQIINYSNWLSYDWKIVPLRDFSQVKRRPPTVAYRVEGASPDTGGVNVEEARHLVSLIAACIEQPEYGDSTFGIISMLGDDQRGQAGYINRLLAEVLPATEIERRQISCGNAYYFQGDERDVIFLSLVAAAGLGTQLRFLSPEAANERYKKRFNVAASRARDQIWVVHSLDPLNDLQPGDLRRDLILHAMNPDAYQHPAQTQVAPFETEFERLVRRDLIRSGFRVIPKWRIGSYRMDMVVEGDGRRVAIECDGDKPYPFTAMEHDLTRQQILERLGWQFIRIRGSQYFRDPERTIKAVIDALESIMLTADGNSRPHQQPGPDGLELKERVIARAVEIRKTILVRSEELRLRLA